MDLTMYNVGFGDCFLLEESIERNFIQSKGTTVDNNTKVSCKLLLDCGSKNGTLPNNRTFDKIVDILFDLFQFSNNVPVKRYALLTHFHEDHYKGFLKMSKDFEANENLNRFDKFYVPYITWNDRTAFIFVKAAIYLYCFGPKQEESKFFLFKHIEMLKNSVKNLKDIHCLKRNDEFDLGNRHFKVLWPDFPKGTHTRKIDKILDKIEKEIKNEEEWNGLTDKFLRNIRDFYELINDGRTIKDEANHVNDILKNQKDYLILLDARKKNFGEKSNALVQMINELNDIFKKDINATSIVICDSYHQMLMMGDITKYVIDNHLFSGNWEYIKRDDIVFKFLKAPHHGTSTHYTVNIPASENLLISTGQFDLYPKSKISDEYFEHRLSEGERTCTSGRTWCYVLEKGRKCTNAVY